MTRVQKYGVPGLQFSLNLAPWHGVQETVWLHCDEAQKVGCLRGLEGFPLV